MLFLRSSRDLYLWSEKLSIVRVTVVTYAMVGVSVHSGYRRSENARLDNTCGAVEDLSYALNCILYLIPYISALASNNNISWVLCTHINVNSFTVQKLLSPQ